MGSNDYESSAELRAFERAKRGADSAKADVPADPRLQPYVPRHLQADGRGDGGAELPHAGPHDCAAKLRTVEIAHTVALDAAVAPALLQTHAGANPITDEDRGADLRNVGPHGWTADLQTVEQAYAMANMAKADVPADKERGADLRNVGPHGWAADLQTVERPYRSADGAKADVFADAATYSADVPADAAAIAFAIRDPDGAAHDSADGGAHRNSVVRAYGGADDRAHQQADGRTHFEANRRTFSGAHGRAYAFTKRCSERRSYA